MNNITAIVRLQIIITRQDTRGLFGNVSIDRELAKTNSL